MTVDVLAVGAHPDDVELGCGATLALLAEQGRRVGIVHLTSGEAGTRGSAELRRREAALAAEVLGAAEIDFLDCGDGGLRTGAAEEDALIEKLRELTPRLVLVPAPRDRHPDHGRAHRLTLDACFYAGLAKRSPTLGSPHRPQAVYSYMQHDAFEPTFVVDVTSTWNKKMKALEAYESQFLQPGRPGGDGAPTKVSSPEFLAAAEGRARHYGLGISAVYGEPFLSPSPLAVTDPWALLPQGSP